MKIKLLIVSFFALLTFVGFCGCIDFDGEAPGPEVKEYFDYEYAASNDTLISVSNVNGAINISSWDGQNISLNATKRSRYGYEDLKNAEIQVIEDNNKLTITIKHVQPIRSRAVDLLIKIPNNVTVESASSDNGPINIFEIAGNPILSTTNGPIFAEAVEGYVKASSTNGGIDIKDTTGIDDISTTNGGITVEILDFLDDVNIQTTNGGITVYMNSSINANIEISTVNGGITVDDFINVTQSSSKYLSGTIGIGGDTIYIQTTNGGIKVFELLK